MRHHNTNLGVLLARGAGIHDVLVADRKRHQVTRQRRGFHKLRGFHAIARLGFRKGGRVGKRHLVFLHVQCQLPGDLVGGLIETRVCPPRPDVLKLRIDVPLAAILHLEDALHVLATDLALIGDVQPGSAGAYWVRERKSDVVLRGGNHLDGNLLAGGGQGGDLYRDLIRIQPKNRG